ncbi:MAG: hypothetical protein JWQ87_3390 [Candidatus Sulfotelmatobacter sp.]|nr:hypothetical protein [Candidatus Sulfotelmatobacter sp.]
MDYNREATRGCMGSLRFGAGLGAVVTSSLLLFLAACGGSKPPGPSPFPGKITLNPSNSFSMQVGATLLLSASAQNASGAAISTAFTFATSNSGILDIAPNGFACAGVWNAPLYSICTPAGTGTVQVSASALGATSPPTMFFIHPPIDNIKISVAPPVNSPPPACPSQVALPAACNLKFNSDAANHCISQNQVQTLQATAFSQGSDVTASVGPFTWSEANGSVIKVTPLVNTDINVATYQATVSPGAPGQTQVVASASGVFSQPFTFETCPIQCIALQVGANGTQGSGVTSFSVNKGTSETITATAVDVQGCVVPKAPLTWVSSSPAAISASCAAGTESCAVSTPQPGTAAISASCTPPTCNIGFPLNPAAYPLGSIFIPGPVYPITAISGLVTGAPVSTSVLATTQDCAGSAFCTVGLYNASTATSLSGSAAQMPAPPNSLMFDATGDRAFAGSQFGAFVISPGNFGGSTSPFASLPASGTTLGLVTGKVIAVSSNGSSAIFSDTVSTPNQVYVVSSLPSSTTALNINSAIAAAISPDGLKSFILGNGGNTLYVYSTLQSLQTYPLAAPATSIAFNSTGSFALLAGGNSPATLAIRNTCDNSAVNLAVTGTGLPGPPLFLKMIPAGDVPMGNLTVPIPLQTDGLDFFFGLDNTGIDIIATNTSLLPLPLPAGPLTLTTLCPRPIVLAQTATNAPVPFEPVHINIGYGTFHPINFFLSPDTSQVYIVTTDFGVLIYSFNTGTVSRIQLVNGANPVAADAAADGSLIYVAGSDGLLHELNTATGLDQNQTSFIALPNSNNDFCFTGNNCALNLVAVKP